MMAPEKAAVIGGGVIGGGWVARLSAAGCDVSIHDPHPDAKRYIDKVLARHEAAQQRLWPGQSLGGRGRISYADSIAEAVKDADLVQESVPERLDVKRRVHHEIGSVLKADAVVGSSTSGLLPSDMQRDLPNADRLLVAHPFNPVYLLPVVEIVGGEKTSPDAIDKAMRLYAGIGMKPVRIRKEIDAFVGDRLLEAMWRESLWLVKEGVATAGEIDDIVRFGLGLRYAQMGQFMTYRLGGGEGGFRHFLEQFGPSLQWPWTKLMDVPEWTDELIETITSQSDAHADGASIDELAAIRDRNLVDFLKALRHNGWGAGTVLRNPAEQSHQVSESGLDAVPLVTFRGQVLEHWTDYNDHMTEFRYLEVFSMATDRVLLDCGGGAGYAEQGASFYTLETHIRHLDEVAPGEPIRVETRLIAHDSKKLHFFHEMYGGEDDRLLATGEHMVLHVDMKAHRGAAMPPEMMARVQRIAEAQKGLDVPHGSGAAVGMKRKRTTESG